MRNCTLLPKYTIECYLRVVEPLMDQHRSIQQTWGSHILKLDGNFKLDTDGLVTVMDHRGLILANWMGTSSYYDLAGPLTALGLRSKLLGLVREGCRA
jgi:hypothetical protein